MQSRTIIFLFVLIFVFSCKDDKDVAPEDELEAYVNMFYDEAIKRNVSIPGRSQLAIRFVSKSEVPPPYTGDAIMDPPTVRIVKDYWSDFTTAQKETTVFHELGHALLQRVHIEERLANCDAKSLMRSGAFWPYESQDHRDYYVDELFDVFTPVPSWGGTMASTRTVVSSAIEDLEGWEFHADGGATHMGTKDNEEFLSGPHSMAIGGTGSGGVAYWYHPDIIPDDVPVGASLVITAEVKTEDLTGNGLWIFVQANPASVGPAAPYSSTSDTYRIIKGTNDWNEVKITLHCYPSGKPPMQLFLGIDGAGSGKVWVDKVELDYYK